jgi:HEAT repeat protein
VQNLWNTFVGIWLFGDWTHQFLLILTVYILTLLFFALGLVALTVRLHKSNTEKASRWKSLEAKWDPITSSIVAGFMPPQALLEKVNENEKLFFVDYLMRFVPKLAGETRKMLCDMAIPYLDQLAERMENGDEEQRSRAVLTLSTMGFERYQDLIVKAIYDPSPLVAMLAARSLSDTGASQYLGLILAKIDIFRTWSAAYLTSMLESLSRNAPLELLNSLKQGGYPDWVQAIIIRALAQLNCLEAVPAAAQLLRDDVDQEVQSAAFLLLAKLGQTEYKPLIRGKCQHENFVIRLNAIKALAQLGDSSDASLLEELLKDPSHWVALQAAEALKATGSLDVLNRFADTDHPHAELALQVLYDQASTKELEVAVRSQTFSNKVPQWLRSTYRRRSAVAWRRVGHILYLPETHIDVRKAIAINLRPEADISLYQDAITHLFSQQFKEDPSFLVHVLYRIRPEQSLETLSQFFFQTSHRPTQETILKIFKHHPGANQRYSAFIQNANQLLKV